MSVGMGAFPTLAAIYVIFAFVFQFISIGIISFDKKCSSHRLAWAIFTFFTGPIGIVTYLFKGRK